MTPVGQGSTSDSAASRKLGLSCAECRRSKLKCDRSFPCQSCIRRGCPGICPSGTLAATKGNKVLLAQVQSLTEQVKSLNARVRELEAALAQTRTAEELSVTPSGSHLDPGGDAEDDIGVKDVSEGIGSLCLGLEGQAKYHGESAGSEYFQDLLPSENESELSKPTPVHLPAEIMTLLNAFPFGLKDCPYEKLLFLPYLPSRQRALELASVYYEKVAWMYDPISYDDFMTSILTPMYGAQQYGTTDGVHSHRLSVFFMILAHGNLYESHASATAFSRQYHTLARAALSLDSILLEVTCATVQALFLVIRFIYNSDQTGKEERWLLTGLCARVAQTLGLQRDSAVWNLDPEEVQRRRRLYWELFTWESWSSFVNGRPGALLIQHTDCQFADDPDFVVTASGEKEYGFHAWKFRYSATCLSISVDHVFSMAAPTYSALLNIDKTIRNFPIPNYLRCPGRTSETGRSWSSDHSLALQQYCALCLRGSNLLYIHRSYFAEAIREASDNPLRHKYAPSVLATYRSACRLISSLRDLYPICPFVCNVWYFWSGIFSSCVVLGALVVKSPGCTLTKDAMHQLEMTLPFFEEGSRECRPQSTLTFLQKLYKRASSSYSAFKAGLDDRFVAGPASSSEPDELEVLGGRKSVITTKSNPSSFRPPNSPTFHYEGSDGSSPESQTGAAEMLMEYYQQIEMSPHLSGKTRDFSMAESPSRHPQYEQVPIQAAASGYVPHVSSEEHVAGMPSDQADPNVSSASASWPSSYPMATHPSGPPVYMQYGPSMPLQTAPSASAPYGYPGSIPEQNQNEIWRNFILEFGGSS